jgi:hypothetical protein
MPYSLDIRVGIQKIVDKVIITDVVETPGDQVGSYFHSIRTLQELIALNRSDTLNPQNGVLSLEEFERNQRNITELTLLVEETRRRYPYPQLILQKKLFGKIPVSRRIRLNPH